MHGYSDDATIEILKKRATQDSSVDVRIAAAESLAHWNSEDVQEVLLECVGDEDPAVAHIAGRALSEMTGMEYGSDHSAWVAFFNGEAAPQPPANPLTHRHGLLKKFIR
jgi:hypothetical protein